MYTKSERKGHLLGAVGFVLGIVDSALYLLSAPMGIVICLTVAGFIFSLIGTAMGKRKGLAIAGIVMAVALGAVEAIVENM